MIDYAKITVRAGNGGQGSGSFMRIRGRRHAKADGGDGGGGGSVYFEATSDLNTLEPFRFIKKYEAENGQRGLSKKRKGADGGDLVIKVPAGTEVRLQTTDYRLRGKETAVDSRQWTVDLIEDNQKILIARGGQGGRGNTHIKDESGRRPRSGEEGSAGEILNLTLELKLIADVGLIGLPNAGKSTLLSALTSARPKIASYPFTTLEPNLGVMEVKSQNGDGDEARIVKGKVVTLENDNLQTLNETSLVTDKRLTNKRLVLADIPGLIEGASQGRGLGDLFLRHIERTRILVHLIDISQSSDLWQNYRIVRGELKAYSKQLGVKKEIIAFNKIDMVSGEEVDKWLELFKKKKKKVVAISAVTHGGFSKLLGAIIRSF